MPESRSIVIASIPMAIGYQAILRGLLLLFHYKTGFVMRFPPVREMKASNHLSPLVVLLGRFRYFST